MTPASTVREVQVALHDHLLGRTSFIERELVDGGRIPIARRLQIYHHAYRARLQETMQDTFEKTWAYLGDDAFAAAALAYVEGHPPAHRNLRWYGEAFPCWLSQRFPADADIGELAMIDWQLRQAFDGVDAVPVPATALAELCADDWLTLGCRFAPTLCLEPVGFNSISIWHALDRDETPPAAVSLQDHAWLMIWRKGWQPHFRTIGVFEYAALCGLRDGATLAEVCLDLGTRFGDEGAAPRVTGHLQTWLVEELVVGLTGL